MFLTFFIKLLIIMGKLDVIHLASSTLKFLSKNSKKMDKILASLKLWEGEAQRKRITKWIQLEE